MKAIEVKNLSFAYGQQKVLSDISFSIEEGEYVAILGPNGSGKSTLLRLLLGLLRPQKGQILLFGQEQGKFKNLNWIGYLPQRAVHFDQRFPATVEEIVGMYGSENLTWALEQVNLLEKRKELIGRLSGGQQQRALIARALCGKPKLLILDEPTSGVDPAAQEDFYKLLAHLHASLELSIILVSHDLAAVAREVERVICLNKKLFFHGSKEAFFSQEEFARLYSYPVAWLKHSEEAGQ
ncbi:MAG: metal ABC transporter ATP-binding protein [Firmicutes bacterium]|jgi:zinc transport system ATP-binding protein|nr:metal ABC transporter ATP-binding protein [Bacillota bacterium]HQD39202.1 metal ABC transporter ATP-binding protein [Bacillota bacterium]